MKNANQAKIYFNQGTAKVLSAESLAHVGRMSDAYREIEGAIKDYSSAIDLEPENAIYGLQKVMLFYILVTL